MCSFSCGLTTLIRLYIYYLYNFYPKNPSLKPFIKLKKYYAISYDIPYMYYLNLLYKVYTLPYLSYRPYDGPLCPVKGLYHEMRSIVIACRGGNNSNNNINGMPAFRKCSSQ